jgi:hypothetical protein
MSAPDKIYIDRGPNGGWMHRHKRMSDTVAEYVRLDPNTRIVTVDQLERWEGQLCNWTCQDEIRAIIDEVK